MLTCSRVITWQKVNTEFFEQGDLEAKLGLPVTPFMNRHTASIPKQQLGFYDFVARPMFEAFDLLAVPIAAKNKSNQTPQTRLANGSRAAPGQS